MIPLEKLIWTLGAGLGDDFTDEVKEAWLTAYTLLATTMKDAANSKAHNTERQGWRLYDNVLPDKQEVL